MMRRSTSFLSKTRGAGPSSDIALPPKYLYINIQYSPQKIQFILNLWKPVDHFSTFFLKCFGLFLLLSGSSVSCCYTHFGSITTGI